MLMNTKNKFYNMKTTIYKLSFLLLGFAIVLACESPEGETNYTPAEYASPKSFTIAIDATSLTETSSELIYTPTATGTGYFVVTTAGSATPTSTQVHDGSASGLVQSGSFDVDGSTPVVSALDTDLMPGYSYKVHAIHQSTDNFISENVVSTSFTTPDTTAPMFLPGDSVPSLFESDLSPFLTSVTLAFSEQVFYQGGDITFEGFFDGAIVVLTAADFDASTDGTTALTFTTSDMWGVDDFMIGSFAAGNFVDNVGLEVAELGGFDYYFSTRALTFAENIELNLTGLYDYTIDDFSGTIPMIYEGQYVVTNDGDQIKVLNAASDYYGIDNDFVFRVQNDDDGDGMGFLFLVDNPTQSIYNSGTLYWHPYFGDIFTGVAGEYNFNTGEFYYWMDFADELGWQGGFYLGYFAYNFTPANTGRMSSRFEGGQFENLPEEIKIEQDLRNASNNQNEDFENRAETIKLKQDMQDIRINSGVSIHPSANDMEFTID